MFPAHRWLRILIPAVILGWVPSTATLAQIDEVEPNDTCVEAQWLGDAGFPMTLHGALDRAWDEPDIDFFRLRGVPGTLVQIDHRGNASGGGTLGDPYLGVLDGACQVIAADDDSGEGTDSRCFVEIPADGWLVIAASSYPDGGLTGNGGSRGSYALTVDVPHVVRSIAARLVDAETGLPLGGGWPTQARAELFRCFEGGCFDWVGVQWADDDGRVLFTLGAQGTPLSPGVYELRAWADAYEPASSGPFEAFENEAADVGEIALQPLALIGSISGRIVDALDGLPLRGDEAPWAAAELIRCREWGCSEYVGSTNADPEGRFRFDRYNTWAPLEVGSYLLRLRADQYRPGEFPVDSVAEDENRAVGRLPIAPFPVQFGGVEPCVDIPSAGGPCRYSVEIRAGGDGQLDGEAWSIVSASPTGSFLGHTLFQAGFTPSRVPVPDRIRLKPGQRQRLRFAFDVPRSLQEGAWICAAAFVGARPDPYFATLGFHDLFCVVKRGDAYGIVPEKEVKRRQAADRTPARARGR